MLVFFIFKFEGYDKKKGSEEKLRYIEYEEYVHD